MMNPNDGRRAATLSPRSPAPDDEPTAVVMQTDDGEREEVFATRFQAELFLYYLPMMALLSEEFAAVRSAILSPLRTAATQVT